MQDYCQACGESVPAGELTLDHIPAEYLRHVMRQWTTGVTVVTCRLGERRHGMTVNSFTAISLDPPLVAVTLALETRTQVLLDESGQFGITILNEDQAEISDRFAGRIPEDGDRFEGIETFELPSGVILIQGGLAYLECKVAHSYGMKASKLYVGEVVEVKMGKEGRPLVYHNRLYRRLGK